jgi:hypothetical protein
VSARSFVALAALLALAAPAQAAHIDFGASDLGGGSVVETDLGPGALAFDPAFPTFAPMTLAVVVDAGDTGAPLAWNALVDNLTGELWSAFSVQLVGATFAAIGSADGNGGAVTAIDASASIAVIRFGDPGEAAGLDLGNALGNGTDWQIDLGALGAGGTFSMILTPIPEPGSAALVALGLAGLAARRARAGPGGR